MTTFFIATVAATFGYIAGAALARRRAFALGVGAGRLLQLGEQARAFHTQETANSAPVDPLAGAELAAYREAVARKAWEQ